MIVLQSGSKTITISRNADPSSRAWLDRLNHFSRQTVSGGIITYDSGCSLLHGVLVVKLVSYAEMIAFRNFVNDDLRYSLRQFSLSANSCDDLGLGKGVALTICKLDDVGSTKDLIEPRSVGDKSDIRIPYVCRLNGSGGLGEI